MAHYLDIEEKHGFGKRVPFFEKTRKKCYKHYKARLEHLASVQSIMVESTTVPAPALLSHRHRRFRSMASVLRILTPINNELSQTCRAVLDDANAVSDSVHPSPCLVSFMPVDVVAVFDGDAEMTEGYSSSALSDAVVEDEAGEVIGQLDVNFLEALATISEMSNEEYKKFKRCHFEQTSVDWDDSVRESCYPLDHGLVYGSSSWSSWLGCRDFGVILGVSSLFGSWTSYPVGITRRRIWCSRSCTFEPLALLELVVDWFSL
ncbi:hypothetical protein BDA99DRAFT_534250 [Phascolomyces articulosus]|uniref:Uncharacterized protein n=1 Tax=Phascolomyces articulosus TaxID=60185 RepID=A0AAD5K6P2_9FUNG|nr:hypothetical protein BDA99DRAFT_534250 [Phascolomyces articulosus]